MACSNCGFEGRQNEVNSLVVQRRTLVSRVEAEIVESTATNPPSATDLQAWVASFTASLADCINVPLSASSAKSMGAMLSQLDAWLSLLAQPTLRPLRAETRASAEVVRNLSQLWPSYKEALQTLDPLRAQVIAAENQTLLDGAAEPLAALREREYAFEPMNSPEVGDVLERTLACLGRLYPGQALWEIEEAEAKSLQDDLHLEQVPSGLGVELALSRAVAGVFFDEARFETNFHASFGILSEAGEMVSEVARQPRALSSLRDAFRAQSDAFEAHTRATAVDHDDRFALRQLLRLHAEVMEECLLPVLAWFALSLGLKNKSFDKVLAEDSTALAALLEKNGYAHLIEGAEGFMRHAASHGHSYELTDGQVTFRLRSFNQSLSLAEIEDKTLALFESVISMTLALRAYLVHAGLLSNDTYLSFGSAGINEFRLACYSLTNKDCKLIASQDLGNSWYFEVESQQPSLIVASSLGSTQGVAGISIIMRRPGVEGFAQVPAQLFDNYIASADTLMGENLVLTTLELLAECRDETGKTLVKPADIQFATGCLGINLLSKQDHSLIPQLRRLRKLVKRLHFDEELAQIDDVFSAFRAGTSLPQPLRRKLLEAIERPEPKLPTAGTIELV